MIKVNNTTLRPYQIEGVEKGIELKRFINGDEQGLGKTIQTIATLVAANQNGEDVFPVICVVPNSTKINWKREWERFSDQKAMVLTDRLKTSWHQYHKLGVCNVFIVNYESIKKYFVLKIPANKYDLHGRVQKPKSTEIIMRDTVKMFKSIVIDESHRCKSTTTLQTKLVLRLAMGKEHRICLTGTPVVNKPTDLFSQLGILGRLRDLGPYGQSFKAFQYRYCNGVGSSNLVELKEKLNSCFFRREKVDVAKDLPEKERQKMIVEIDNRKEYDHAQNSFKDWLINQGFSSGQINKKLRGEVLVQINALRKLAANGKMKAVVEHINETIDSGEKLIVFCNLKAVVAMLKNEFPFAVTVTGDDDAVQKQSNIDKFQNDANTKLIICNIRSAGVGITLTASSRVAFVELPWTFADCVQCEDRSHRIGQKDNVLCTYFLAENSIDEWMFALIHEKKELTNAITGATDEFSMLDVLAEEIVNGLGNTFKD